jgi:uncharacterized protein YndB with AHSA1/START domain
MSKPSYVYITYIQTTPERVWNALIDPELTKDYWGRRRNVSDWRPGSSWRHEDYDNGSVAVAGQIIESDPPRRLVLTWAHPGAKSGAKSETPSRVTFEIESFMGAVRLTVTHEELDAEMLRAISAGWPAVLSSLKTLLETGASLPMTRQNWKGRATSDRAAEQRQ